MLPKQWLVYPPQPELSKKVAQKLGLSPLLGQLLLNRNIRSLDEAEAFLNPSLTAAVNFETHLLEPFWEKICQCITDKKRILLYGDYDVDGMTSVSMFAQCLKQLGAVVDIYIPHRLTEGYGLNIGVVDFIKQAGIELLITLDCGISNVVEINAVKELGTFVVILDHHTLPDVLPGADIILNPKFYEAGHPLYPLCTAGIVYKCIEFFASKEAMLKVEEYLDLAALGTIADVALLSGENRRLVFEGLPVLSKRGRLGLRALMEVGGFEKNRVDVRDVGFSIAPRLNAAGRLASAKLGVDLLLSTDEKEAEALAFKLQQLNENRQALGQAIFQDASEKCADTPVIALASASWHPGVVGIIASRLVEAYGKPVVLIAVQNGVGRGSARTVGQVNIYELLKQCSRFFETFGGHKEAAGFSIKEDNISAFCSEIQTIASDFLSDDDMLSTLDIDAELNLEDVSTDFVEELSKLGPFGQGNPTPTFYSNALKVIEARPVGKGQHLKFRFSNRAKSKIVDGIGFGLGNKVGDAYKSEIEVAFSVDVNTWAGETMPQLSVIDLK